MLRSPTKTLLEVTELIALLSDPSKAHRLKIVNANYPIQLPTYAAYNPPVKANHIFINERIPSSRHIDISDIGDKSQGLPCMLPKPDQFKDLMAKLDIGINDHVVCYGDDNVIGACRVFWMFKVFGFPNVSVLNGTFALWKEKGGNIETGEESWKEKSQVRLSEDFEFKYNKDIVAKMEEVKKIVTEEDCLRHMQLIDTRKSTVYKGDTKNLRSGHIPGFNNIPFIDVLHEDGSFKSQEDIELTFGKRSFNKEKPTILSCNSGMTACVLYVALNLLGHKDLSLYDGSWTEWVKFEENPVVQGE